MYFAFSECSSSLASIEWRLYDESGRRVSGSPSLTCSAWYQTGLPAGRYTLGVTGANRTGTYKVSISAAAPQTFAVSLPASISDGAPASGAGNLETKASQDRYAFTTTERGKLQLRFSECSSTLGSVVWQLVNENGYVVSETTQYACATWTLSNVSPGSYELRVSHFGSVGTYKLLLQSAAPQQFEVSVPASVSNGSPRSGAGNLETSASEDVYAFATSTTERLKLSFSECSSSAVSWTLVNAAGAAIRSLDGACTGTIVADLPPGDYKLKVTGAAGTYKLSLLVPLAPQVFNVTLPVSISNGSPAPGAGNVETADSEDRYRFATSAPGTLQLGFSDCAGLPLLGTVTWTLVNAQTNAVVALSGDGAACGSTSVIVPAGTYQVRVSQVGANTLLQPLAGLFTKTYKLRLAAA